MKKLIAFIKSLFTKKPAVPAKTYAEVKQEAKAQAEKIVAALDEVKATKKNVATNPAAVAGAPAKKKKKYYKPKPKQA